jgi:hypothetical protein
MAHLAPPLTFTLTPRQVAWLDGRRLHGCLSRSAALRLALDELILLEGEQQSGRQWHGPQQSRQRQPTAAAAISATTTAAATTADATAAPGEECSHA